MPSRCPSIDEVVRDVDGELSVNRHEELAAHYLGCAACRTRRAELDAMVARFAVGADEVDPELTRDVMAAIRARRSGAAAGAADDGEGASAGTAAGTSAARGQRPRRARWRVLAPALGALAAAAAAAVLFVVLRPGSPGVTSPGAGSSRFIARGAGSGSGANDPARWVSLLVYRVAAARADATRYAKVEQRISADAKLVFGYRNLGGAYRNLMILAVNAKGRVFWYYPAYRRGDTDPKSVAITAGTHQLGDEVQHDLSAGGALRLIAVFSRRPLQVSQVERAVGRALREAGSLEQLERLPLGAPGQTAQVTRLLRVTP